MQTMPCSDKKVFVTGITGLIGKELIVPLQEAGFEIWALSRQEDLRKEGINWIYGDLFDTRFIEDVMAKIHPSYLLNMAWATTGDYLSSPQNYDFLISSMELLRFFSQYGGKRVVFAGTCFEYKFKETPIKENDELDLEKTTYTFCKGILNTYATRFCREHAISYGYGRIFYAYGKNENKTRLTGMLIDKLSHGEAAHIRSGSLRKDYLYAKDIANAFVKFLDSDVEGNVNICSGKAVTLEEYASTLAHIMKKENLLVIGNDSLGQPPIIVGDNSKMTKEVNYIPIYTLSKGFQEVLNEKN